LVDGATNEGERGTVEWSNALHEMRFLTKTRRVMKRRLVGGALALAVTATAAYAQKVTTDSDPSAAFATYRSYAWTAGTPTPNAVTEPRIQAAVDRQLAGKGLKKVDGNPDLVVAAHLVSQEYRGIIANGFGPWGHSGGFNSTDSQTYVKGTLIVDLYEAGTKKMVWRGVAIDSALHTPWRTTAKIDRALAKMFTRYPPTASSSSR
jgi:hypothetical protein